jgi:ribosomal protein S18 acetylase RimI-like enzyme
LVSVRKCSSEDLQTVTELAERYTSFDTIPTLADIEGMYAKNPEYFLVAEDDNGRVIGFVTGYERKGLPKEVLRTWGANRVGYVDLMAVDMPYRRMGVGKSLIRTLLNQFRRNGIDIVNLDVPGGQDAAIGLYRSLGFSIRAYNMRKRLC